MHEPFPLAAPAQSILTYSNSTGCWLMPSRGGAIQLAYWPGAWQGFISEWMKVYKKGCDEFKSAVEDKFKQVESYFAEAGKGRKS